MYISMDNITIKHISYDWIQTTISWPVSIQLLFYKPNSYVVVLLYTNTGSHYSILITASSLSMCVQSDKSSTTERNVTYVTLKIPNHIFKEIKMSQWSQADRFISLSTVWHFFFFFVFCLAGQKQYIPLWKICKEQWQS